MKNYEDIKIEIAEGDTKKINYYVLIISFDLMDVNLRTLSKQRNIAK